MSRIVAIVCILALFGCAPVEQKEEYRAQQKQEKEILDTTVTHVVWYADETDKESIKRWLKNLMSNRKLKYTLQLEAARLYLMIDDSCREGE